MRLIRIGYHSVVSIGRRRSERARICIYERSSLYLKRKAGYKGQLYNGEADPCSWRSSRKQKDTDWQVDDAPSTVLSVWEEYAVISLML